VCALKAGLSERVDGERRRRGISTRRHDGGLDAFRRPLIDALCCEAPSHLAAVVVITNLIRDAGRSVPNPALARSRLRYFFSVIRVLIAMRFWS